MAYYIGQAVYTPKASAALIKRPQNRRELVPQPIEKLGGRLEGFWFAFGEYDAVLTYQLPDNVTAAALSMAVAAGGSVKPFRITPLMTAEEVMDAMKKAA
jgi:uncharacterized protein with GYD domain